MHKKTVESLFTTCEGLLKSKKLSVTEMGRGMNSNTTPKHCIKRADRLVSNQALISHKETIYSAFIKELAPIDNFLVISVDICFLTPDTKYQVIRGSIAVGGRALTLYEHVFKNGKSKQRKASNYFLKKLSEIVPSSATVVIVTDAGFHNRWFCLVRSFNWDFIGRVRQNKTFITKDCEKKYCNSLHSKAKLMPEYQGQMKLCRTNTLSCHLYTVKKKIKGTKKKNKKGTPDKGSYSKTHGKSQREPWVLASSLPPEKYSAHQIVSMYSSRMQIEEAFRDLKNHRYGFSFKYTLTRDARRLNNLLLIAAIVVFIAWLAGKVAEKKNWQRHYQSNTTKRRVLSHFYLGLLVLSTNIYRIKLSDVKIILYEIKKTSQLSRRSNLF
jgi:hypothetical protein